MKALYETESNTEYLKKAMQIIDIMFGDCKDDFIEGVYGDLERML